MSATIDNIINHISSVKKGEHSKHGICVLLGAGADISSGGILFRELKIKFLNENGFQISNDITDNKLDEEFQKVVDNLSQDGRCETLDKIMRSNSAPSEGYELLVMLAENGFIDAIITTNFDYLLEETEKLLGIKPFTIFTPGRAVPQEYYKKRNKISPIYLKMHGDLSDRLVTHLTKEELESKEYAHEFINLFKFIIEEYSVLVVGYGGYDNLITEIFKQEMADLSEVYWCNICEPNNQSDLVSALNNNNKLKYVNTSFDKLFQKLATTFLRNAIMKNANPIFLPTVVRSKIEMQIGLYKEKIKYPNKIIRRKHEAEQMENFLQTYNEKCLAIIGKYKTGKTSFVYKQMESINDITFFPIMFGTEHSILENIALALGYETKVSFSVLYSFLNWWNQKKEHLVFVIDNLFNEDCFDKIETNYYLEFFNFINVSREFKYVQFIICFQDDIYAKIKNNKLNLYGINNFVEINIKNFSSEETTLLLENYQDNTSIDLSKYQALLSIPYVWEIINTNNIDLTNNKNFYELYVDSLYQRLQNLNYNITKHALNKALMILAYKEIFPEYYNTDINSNVYELLKNQGIINLQNKIIHPEFISYFSSQYFLQDCSWKDAISNKIIPIIKNSEKLSDMHIQMIYEIFSYCKKIDDISFILKQLDNLLENKITRLQNKVITNIIYQCYRKNNELFFNYINQIDINTYSLELQKYLLKLNAELCPALLSKWEDENNILSYSAFIFKSDILYKYLEEHLPKIHDNLFVNYISSENGILLLLHLLTYWGWDNNDRKKYNQLNQIIEKNLIPFIKIEDKTIKHTTNILMKYSYNIFFNAGEDFEEQFIKCKDDTILILINKVLNNEKITDMDFQYLIEINTDINNSWTFILSNIIMIQAMQNYPDETYLLLMNFFDNKTNIPVQHLDFFFSCLFWSLYINFPCNRDRFTSVFEKIVNKYDRVLFMFPESERKASVNKFSEEFQRTFEDGFNPLAFYFYTSLYKSKVEKAYKWDMEHNDLKVYWQLTECMANTGNYSDIIRIVHALGQMISIYPEEGYLALENLSSYDEPIIRRGIIRIYKENYIRFSEITKKEIEKNFFKFKQEEIDEIMYNIDLFLENRTLEQLHWARLFYNLEQIKKINVSQNFLQCILHSNSCSGFLSDFIYSVFK